MKAIKDTFKYTLPVLFGYIPLGFAFGILLQSAGYGPIWAFFMSIFIYAGTGQFLCVELLAVGATIPQVILMTFLLNFRHFFYGLSLINKYKGTGKSKLYMIFGLTDETYALVSTTKAPKDIKPAYFYTAITLLNHIYWIIGSVLGASIGSLLTFNSKGIDFVMTALFAVLVVEQWKNNKNHIPALIGFAVPILSLVLLGADNFLIPALFVVSVLLMCLRPIFEEKEARL
ncbi:MAG: AzlC family ABC transporter permease [Ruminococcus sp.]|nr:AzlC family ABC transporter permease [Ruminococcus sp.]